MKRNVYLFFYSLTMLLAFMVVFSIPLFLLVIYKGGIIELKVIATLLLCSFILLPLIGSVEEKKLPFFGE